MTKTMNYYDSELQGGGVWKEWEVGGGCRLKYWSEIEAKNTAEAAYRYTEGRTGGNGPFVFVIAVVCL